jgi:hypothetical protein
VAIVFPWVAIVSLLVDDGLVVPWVLHVLHSPARVGIASAKTTVALVHGDGRIDDVFWVVLIVERALEESENAAAGTAWWLRSVVPSVLNVSHKLRGGFAAGVGEQGVVGGNGEVYVISSLFFVLILLVVGIILRIIIILFRHSVQDLRVGGRIDDDRVVGQSHWTGTAPRRNVRVWHEVSAGAAGVAWWGWRGDATLVSGRVVGRAGRSAALGSGSRTLLALLALTAS